MSAPDVDELISIAEIARPQGLRGEVIAEMLTDFPERFARLKRVWSYRPGSADAEVREMTVERTWLHKGRVVLKLSGYDDMTSAETLRGVRLAVTRDELVALPPDTYYDFELIGCEVATVSGERVGRVAGVEHYGAAPLLRIDAGGREALVPMALSICTEIDTANKRIVIDPPEGLLDL